MPPKREDAAHDCDYCQFRPDLVRAHSPQRRYADRASWRHSGRHHHQLGGLLFDHGITSATRVYAGGAEGISSGGVASGTVLSSGGEQAVLVGGIASNTVVTSGGGQVLFGGTAAVER